MNNAGLKVKTKTIYLYVLPFFLLFIIAFVIPLLMAFGISFTNWRGGNKIDFIALDNYIKLVKDETFWMSFLNNLKFMALMLVFQIGLAFVFAIVVQNKRVKFQGFHRRDYFPAFGFVIGCCCYDLADCVQQRHWTYIGYNGKDWDGRHCTALAG